jgi:hypothetical protein
MLLAAGIGPVLHVAGVDDDLRQPRLHARLSSILAGVREHLNKRGLDDVLSVLGAAVATSDPVGQIDVAREERRQRRAVAVCDEALQQRLIRGSPVVHALIRRVDRNHPCSNDRLLRD